MHQSSLAEFTHTISAIFKESNMATFNDLNDLRKALEREFRKEEDRTIEYEQNLLKAITIYLCSQKGVSPVQGYKPEEIVSFLEKPLSEIKRCIGGEWASMPDDKFENLIYVLTKKVKKSDKLTTW